MARLISKVEISREILEKYNNLDVKNLTLKVNDLAKKGEKMEKLTEKSKFFIENIIDFAKKSNNEAEISQQLENALKEFYLRIVSEY
ncbi:hypothetical protein [Campylobacter sp. JMF_03 NE3]|uniref:hypothetical protein n=1 Tax=Campylobacter sp. JMF_03 NE3 TaxID=2983831 RepID=UPI0022E9F91D|nr:hypothetical protein [Campylobacter sp. JMF_03 NE3]MDA3053619.1 hypothetical protein [Campylobacter sp. JMF_03 NE3]